MTWTLSGRTPTTRVRCSRPCSEWTTTASTFRSTASVAPASPGRRPRGRRLCAVKTSGPRGSSARSTTGQREPLQVNDVGLALRRGAVPQHVVRVPSAAGNRADAAREVLGPAVEALVERVPDGFRDLAVGEASGDERDVETADACERRAQRMVVRRRVRGWIDDVDPEWQRPAHPAKPGVPVLERRRERGADPTAAHSSPPPSARGPTPAASLSGRRRAPACLSNSAANASSSAAVVTAAVPRLHARQLGRDGPLVPAGRT